MNNITYISDKKPTDFKDLVTQLRTIADDIENGKVTGIYAILMNPEGYRAVYNIPSDYSNLEIVGALSLAQQQFITEYWGE